MAIAMADEGAVNMSMILTGMADGIKIEIGATVVEAAVRIGPLLEMGRCYLRLHRHDNRPSESGVWLRDGLIKGMALLCQKEVGKKYSCITQISRMEKCWR
eukprot:2196559-Pleurochrysis_carterae.AAC.2